MDQNTMEKKVRSVPTFSKGNSELKSSDYNAKKNGSQYSRKRDYEKNDKKTPPYKGSRSMQKYGHSREKMDCQVGGSKSPFEVGSLQRTGGKKQDVTHLVQNWFAPIENHAHRKGYQHHHGYFGKKSSLQHKYKKEHYLQANCQFVIISGNDYTIYEHDPDQLVDWNFIEEVRLHVTEYPGCPICLFPPTAAKITRCGHIFCYSCVLHYLALSDKESRKCPICEELIGKEDLKSVQPILHKNWKCGEDIEFRLMKRERDSLTPVCVNTGSLKEEKPICNFLDNSPYSKLIVASPQQVLMNIVKREREHLQCQLAIEIDEPESCFIKAALNLVGDRETLLEIENQIKDLTNLTITTKKNAVEGAVGGFNNDTKDSFEEEPHIKNPIKSKQQERKFLVDLAAAKIDSHPKNDYFFYQDICGSSIYLHTLNVHILTKEYGNLENCPVLIKGKVIEKEIVSMTTSVRQKMRCLGHLPITSSIEIVEIEMKYPLVSNLTLAEFSDQLKQRERNRRKREREEYKIEKRVRVEEDKMMGRSRGSSFNTTSYKHFPTFKDSSPIGSLEDSDLASFLETSPSSLNCESALDTSLPSFAQMIRDGQKQERKLVVPSHTNKRTSAWGQRNLTVDDSSDEEEKAPDFNTTFRDGFDEAFDLATKKIGKSTEKDSCQKGKKGKKKKKGILLLSSGGF